MPILLLHIASRIIPCVNLVILLTELTLHITPKQLIHTRTVCGQIYKQIPFSIPPAYPYLSLPLPPYHMLAL